MNLIITLFLYALGQCRWIVCCVFVKSWGLVGQLVKNQDRLSTRLFPVTKLSCFRSLDVQNLILSILVTCNFVCCKNQQRRSFGSDGQDKRFGRYQCGNLYSMESAKTIWQVRICYSYLIKNRQNPINADAIGNFARPKWSNQEESTSFTFSAFIHFGLYASVACWWQ